MKRVLILALVCLLALALLGCAAKGDASQGDAGKGDAAQGGAPSSAPSGGQAAVQPGDDNGTPDGGGQDGEPGGAAPGQAADGAAEEAAALAVLAEKPVLAYDLEVYRGALENEQTMARQLGEAGLEYPARSLYAKALCDAGCLRYAAECVLFLKGEGQSLAELTEGSGAADWAALQAICVSSPFPSYFEGLVYALQGQEEQAKERFGWAAVNPSFPAGGVDLTALRDLSVAELYSLRDGLRTLETALRDEYTPEPLYLEPNAANGDPSYLKARASDCLEAADYALAMQYGQAAVLCEPYDGGGYIACAAAALMTDDLDIGWVYIVQGLIIDPENETLLALKAGVEDVMGGEA